MLVLNRKRLEKIIITTARGEQIIITPVEIRYSRRNKKDWMVKIGIEADTSITILREELTTVPEIEPGQPGRKFGKQ